ncbi:MAG: GNAT family N-acetyltransferase [Paraclostridium sordellii]
MNIRGEKVILRAIEEEDLDILKEMINDDNIESLVGGWSFPVSDFQQKQWFTSLANKTNNLRLIIDAEDVGVVGMCSITNIDWKNRVAECNIKICNRPEFRNKGIGRRAYEALIRYAFEELQIHRLEANVLENNLASNNLHKTCGWKKEGIKREAIFKKGKYHNINIYSLLNSENIKCN